jgi:hypothetical protein
LLGILALKFLGVVVLGCGVELLRIEAYAFAFLTVQLLNVHLELLVSWEDCCMITPESTWRNEKRILAKPRLLKQIRKDRQPCNHIQVHNRIINLKTQKHSSTRA